MRILFVSSEVHPFAKTGGLADVASALPAALRQQREDVVTVMPLYRSVDRADLRPIPGLTDVSISFGPNSGTWSGLAHDATRTILIDIPQLYDRDYLYGHSEVEPIRWAALAHVSLQLPTVLGWQPHIVHCNDWQTGLIPLLVDGRRNEPMVARAKTVMTIHNLGYQGHFGSLAVGRLGLEGLEHRLHQDHLDDGYIGFLETGLLHADAITTVSPTYAEEIKTPEGGAGLDWLLAQRSDAVTGILNGIDTDEWDPQTDTRIAATYHAADLSGKQENRTALLEAFELDASPGPPVVGIITRLAYQKGIEIMEAPLRHFLHTWDLRLVVLGSGEQRYEELFEGLADEFDDNVGFYGGYNNDLAHLIEAGSDIFLMPSLYEPCGLNQMYSLVYGTLPVVRRVGGLADTVIDASLPDGNGFAFDEFSENALGTALGRALDLHTRPEEWNELVQRAMAQDFSWAERADEYLALYRSLL
ncbi:MAG: glycogen synthase [Acidimicrobiia bacterium]|nr:glycogen synthase [Acidimicrobiia bacterium]